LNSFITEQQKLNDQLATHVHVSTFPGTPTLPAINVMLQNLTVLFKKIINQDMGIYLQKSNIAGIKIEFLLNPNTSIRSKHNKVN
jgi:hypothetical protein